MGAVTPYIAVDDARDALDWYVAVFGATLDGEPIVMPDGRVGHAQIEIGSGRLMLSDAHPEIGVRAPGADGNDVTLHAEVPDADEVVRRAVEAGAELQRPVKAEPYGRSGVIRDPFGHRWMVQTATDSAVAGSAESAGKHGDIGYITVGVADTDKARAFYGAVLGWAFGLGDAPGGVSVEGPSPMMGLTSAWGRHEVQLCYQVDDIETALAKVRGAGGEAGDGAERPYGRLAECTDDQGIHFQLWQPPS